MEAMRSSWTDERLDDLNGKVDKGFARVDGEIKELRGEMNARFSDLNSEMNSRFDALNQTLIRCSVGLASSVVGLIIAFVLTAH
jgi:hypothetical protein